MGEQPKQIVVKNEVFESVSAVFKKIALNTRFPMRTAFSIAKLYDQYLKAEKVFDSMRTALITKYADKYDKGNPKLLQGRYTFSNDNGKEFEREWRELLDCETDIKGQVLQVKTSEVPADLLCPADILALQPFIDFVD